MRIRSIIAQLIAIISLALPGVATALPTQIRITGLQLPPGLPAPPSNLEPLSRALVIEATSVSLPDGADMRLVIRIRQSGVQICGNTPQTGLSMRATKQIRVDGATASGAWAACNELPAGTYTLCAQFYSLGGEPLSEESCGEFKVAAAMPEATYTAPVNFLPADGSHELVETFRKGLRFSWKPVTPVYEGPVTYRLRVWKIAPGKDAATAIRETPVLTRDLTDATETILINALPIENAPGNSTRFAWNVQALNALGKSIGPNAGISQASVVAATTYAIRLDKISVSCTSTPGVYSFSYSLTNPNLGSAKLTALLATSSIPTGAAISAFSPPLNTNIPAGSQLTVTGTITASPGLSSICIGAQITDQTNSFWQASRDTCIPVKPCKCEACDPKKVDIKVPASTITVNTNNTVTLAQPLSVVTTPLKLVKAVGTELVYFSFAPDDEDCMPCNRDSRSYGNFLSGSLGPAAGTGAGTHALEWMFAPPKVGSAITPFSSVISLPPMVKCCDATLRFCIRYVITFADCTVCYKLVCYEKRLDGCSSGVPSSNNN